MTHALATSPPPLDGPELSAIRDMVRPCMQCGTCTASCPNAFAMDVTPRTLWRLLLLGDAREVLASKAFWLCSSCYACTLRCPRGLPLTAAMAALKRLAAAVAPAETARKAAFYATFMDNVRKFGRVQEMDLMLHYFLAAKDPALPLSYTPLGMKMLMKGKLHGAAKAKPGKLGALFDNARTKQGGRP